jgi:hypothetical protein
MEMKQFDKEQAIFEANKSEWLQTEPNKWVWIHDGQYKFFPEFGIARCYGKFTLLPPVGEEMMSEE